jgi:hypothetical protein
MVKRTVSIGVINTYFSIKFIIRAHAIFSKTKVNRVSKAVGLLLNCC